MKFKITGYYWHPNGYKKDKKFTLEFRTKEEMKAAAAALKMIPYGLYFKTNEQIELGYSRHDEKGHVQALRY